MSKVVGTRTEIKNGMEYDIQVTCCMEAKEKIRCMEELEKTISKIFDHFRPEWIGLTQMHAVLPPVALKYCPTCGDRYEKNVE